MEAIISQIEQYPFIPIFYHDDIEHCKAALKACYQGGIRVFEFVNRGPLALENFTALKAYRDANFSELSLGIGTIKNQAQAEAFAKLKPDFMVSPIVKREIAEVTSKSGIPWIPGVMTATEIDLADDLGASLVKVFPGDVLGNAFLKAVKPLFPGMKFMITGGVALEEQNLKDWFRSGATAVGIGSKLFSGMDANRGIEDRIKQAFGWIRS